MNSSFLADVFLVYVFLDTISQYPPAHINASISLEECFCLMFR